MTAHKNPGIQWMRAVAALLVIVDHGLYTLVDKAGGEASTSALGALFGGTGVSIFFLISGVVMVTSSTRAFGPGASAEFLRRRLTRIVPLFWLTTLVYAVKLWGAGAGASGVDILRSLLFIPFLNAHGEIQPVYGLGWTLDYEIFFYLIFALGLLGSLRTTLGLCAAVLLGATLWGAGLAKPTGPESAVLAYFFSRPIMLFFVAGMALPFVLRRLSATKVGVLPFRWAAAIATLLVWLDLAASRAVDVPVPVQLLSLSLPLLLAARSVVAGPFDARAAALATVLGDASYSIYLTHSFVIGPLGRVYGKLGFTAPGPYLATSLVACALVGVLCYRYVETPLLRALSGRRKDAGLAAAA